MLNKWIFVVLISIFFQFTCTEDLHSNHQNEVKMEHERLVYNTSSIEDFPNDLFTDYQRKHGAVAFHLMCAIYFFTLLAVVCSEYFLPSVECVCEDLKISKDVAACTFMAAATMAPEAFANIVSTFIAESDVGMGGVLGSLLFNVLAVAACAGLATPTYLQFDWWPITRDSILYASTVSLLIVFTWDQKITLIESAIMVGLILIYFIVLIQNRRIMNIVTWLMKINFNCCRLSSYDIPTSFIESNVQKAMKLHPNDLRLISNTQDKSGYLHGVVTRSSLNDGPIFMIYTNNNNNNYNKNNNDTKIKINEKKKKNCNGLWQLPFSTRLKTFWWIYTWPIKLVLTLTIPNPKKYRRMYPITFVMCIVWIALNSYMVIWMLSVIGYSFSIPDVIMGLTFLSAGNCTPEAIASVLMVLKGENGVGCSNSLGSSSLDILLSLGLPWFIRNLLNWKSLNSLPFIEVGDVRWTACLLLISVIVLYATFSFSKYRIHRYVGLILLSAYLILITISILLEMNLLY